ncbi:MAG TPA: LytTR family DNA-binding domain-containing protein [Chitinophaga sp.]|uniref:LytR/AlgR family response regulator transcription factor n=1 Tax=Chitinophaga sp. TaxID=1869181 RepID=UPI002DC00935|nr:LytTR family DNA-binding domain-containing protein [Chitinophaga sp.]HEU4553866.1 LytTR family DNA-binding domain-containing protein [Chitinophaga sp.]
MITAIALDDEPPALEIIKGFCANIPEVALKKTFTKAGEAFEYLEKYPVDLLLLDIHMPSINGFDFYRRVPARVMVIFTTSHSEHAAESYNLSAVDYLVKPYTLQRFRQAMEKAVSFHQLRQNAAAPGSDHITLRVDYGLVKIFFADILFMEGLDNYLKIHLKDKTPLVVRMTMKTILEKLPPAAFARVHRSFIVPLSQVAAVRNKMIALHCGEEIPLGSNYENDFMHLMNR